MPTKVVLITGAAIRIGACIARTFHSKGFDVAISYRSSLTAAQALIDELNAIRADSASCWPAEMTDQASVNRLGRDVLAHHKRLDVLINNGASPVPRAYICGVPSCWWYSARTQPTTTLPPKPIV